MTLKALFYFLVTCAAGVGLAYLSRNDPGYVLLAHGDYTVETSLAVFLALLLVLFGLLYFTLRLGLLVWRARGSLREWRRRRSEGEALRATRRGLKALLEENWQVAERELARGAEHPELRLYNYLMAARAADRQGAGERRDQYVTLAHKSGPDGELAAGLAQAGAQLEHGQLEQALATLTHLRAMAPKQLPVMQLLARLYERLGSWPDLLETAIAMRKLKADDAEVTRLELRAHRELLEGATGLGRPERLREVWRDLPKGLRTEPELVGAYADGLIRLGYGVEAEELLREALKRGWNPELVRLYGLAQGEDELRQLAQAESWALEHERDPALLLALGRIAARRQLWGKARAYFEASAGQDPNPESLRELGELLERLQEGDAARECYYRALSHGRSRPKALPGVAPAS